MAFIVVYLAILLASSLNCEAHKILIISSMASKSHTMLGNALVRHITKAGHEVTYVTSLPNNKPAPNVTIIDVSDKIHGFISKAVNVQNLIKKERDILSLGFIFSTMKEISVMTLEHPNMQKLINDPNERFDLIIAEWIFNDIYAGLPAIFECPFIWFSTVEPHWMILKTIDELPNSAYNSDVISGNVPPLTFMQRVKELSHQISGLVYKYFIFSPIENKEYERLIACVTQRRGKTVPSFEELRNNISLVLGNSHVSIGQATRLPQNYIPIGGYHIETDVKPLPQDLQTIMDNAKNGVIYFSLGSNLKSKDLPLEIKNDLINMFAKLKQTIIWKFEENLSNRPKNLHIVQWAPQPSILAHPNCIIFITHGGYLSSTETIHFGVPIIGIPAYGDQFINIDRAVKKGYAKRVDLSYNLTDELKMAITDLLSDIKYRNKAKELSLIYHDRPLSPGDELVHWVEHVIRTGGALHLRSPALQVTWYQKTYLDLAAAIVLGFVTLMFIFKNLLSMVSRIILNNEKEKKK